ncbi:MAG TPA: cysteine--tRNA ligase [Saprospiraceae bacterium]|nr:cysteine--tRNA ligase [Saprospiraceae bacterium]
MSLVIYNSLSREKEEFIPIHPGRVGMYVCGPTVYSDVHIGNCRTFVSFDLIYRYLLYKGFKVRYVRNITDVGHLVGDVDIGGEDKIAEKARLEQLEPMEIVQRYTNGFHDMMRIFNNLPPNIEPSATGHIVEQIQMVQEIIDNGYGYVVNGSVYFDTVKFVKEEKYYGQLSGRVVEELINASRDDLKNQDEKRSPADFAIWIKAGPTHLMRWPSPWSIGFPGWHLECSVMSTKYLGKQFDIHGGGADLKFPHHENEVAQNFGAYSCAPARYWMHANMLLMNGSKMAKSEGNYLTPHQLFTGESEHISKAYNPEVVRFFMLQAHYRSTLDLTDDALSAAEKGLQRLMETFENLQSLRAPEKPVNDSLIKELKTGTAAMETEMDDDFNVPRTLARIFEVAPKINGLKNGQIDINLVDTATVAEMQTQFGKFIHDVFGLRKESGDGNQNGKLESVMQLVLELRQKARENKDWATADKIRDALIAANITVKDGKEGTKWS